MRFTKMDTEGLCFSTKASAASMLNTQPRIFRCLGVNWLFQPPITIVNIHSRDQEKNHDVMVL